MKLLADLHTHSKNSRFKHGKSSIEEMAIEANEIGLVEIGITDHGYSHLFRTSKAKLKEARAIVDEINKWSKTKVLLGIEADIISDDGTLDLDNETLALLDILIISYHRMTSTNFANFFGFAKKSNESKQKCTNAFVNAIKKYPVTIVAHLDSILTTDLYEIGKACREHGTMVEINNRHTKWTQKQIDDLLASECMFVVSSDAHAREDIGRVDKAYEIIRKYNIPSERIANVEFSEDEKSELDREYSAYQSLYEQLEKIKKDKEDIIEKRNKTEITGKLSTEMEEELRKIANEKGLEYKEARNDSVESEYMKTISQEDVNLINQAEEYIRNRNFEEAEREFQEDNNFEEETEKQAFDDNHPLFRESFEDRFQPFNNKALLGVEEDEEVNIQPSIEPVEQEDIRPMMQTNSQQSVQPVQDNTFGQYNDQQEYAMEKSVVSEAEESEINLSGSAYEQLSSSSSRLQEFKDIMSGDNDEVSSILPQQNHAIRQIVTEQQQPVQNAQQRQVFKKVEPENFMDSITQTRLVNGAKPVISNQAENSSQVTRRPVIQKGGKRGGFIAVDGLLGGDEK